MSMAKVGADIGLFRKLSGLEPGSSRTVDQLAGETGADAELLGTLTASLSDVVL